MSRENYDFVLSLRAIRSYRADPLDRDHLAAILEAARWTGSAKNLQNWSFIVIEDQARLDALAACGDFTGPIRTAAAAIVLVQEPGGYEFDIGRVAQNIMLAAKAIGVASCPVTLHRDHDARAVLEVPDDRRSRYAIALGYPGAEDGPGRFGGRKPAEALIHEERYR